MTRQNLQRAFFYLRHDPATLLRIAYGRAVRGANLFYGKRTGRSFHLHKLWLPLTFRCNLRCQMCGQWGDLGRSKTYAPERLKTELSIEKWKRIVAEAAPQKPKVCLIGGEPFLYEAWEPLARYVRRKDLWCEVTTNGLLLEANAAKAVEVFDAVHVSLDGPPALNDDIRGLPGGFKRAFEGLRRLHALRESRGRTKPFLSVCCTLSWKNMSGVEAMAEAVEGEKVPVDLLLFQHLEIVTPRIVEQTNAMWRKYLGVETDWWRANCHDMSRADLDGYWRGLKRVRSRRFRYIRQIMQEPDLTRAELAQFYLRVEKPLARFRGTCLAPFQEAFVFPDGEIWSCPGLSMGNVAQGGFKAAFNGESYRKLRRTLAEVERFPVCTRCANFWHNWST